MVLALSMAVIAATAGGSAKKAVLMLTIGEFSFLGQGRVNNLSRDHIWFAVFRRVAEQVARGRLGHRAKPCDRFEVLRGIQVDVPHRRPRSL